MQAMLGILKVVGSLVALVAMAVLFVMYRDYFLVVMGTALVLILALAWLTRGRVASHAAGDAPEPPRCSCGAPLALEGHIGWAWSSETDEMHCTCSGIAKPSEEWMADQSAKLRAGVALLPPASEGGSFFARGAIQLLRCPGCEGTYVVQTSPDGPPSPEPPPLRPSPPEEWAKLVA